ncbi:hypothetical protein L2E82_11481 [Cichorium intybus]|uniref:Uncharacterized protein n=1 Tax=Cichorium intybus TaxID=13427 RepID=A0ACB9GEM9_CICIN|nr:hypothetical protein L2E82_11481 [Cichorium intybus]
METMTSEPNLFRSPWWNSFFNIAQVGLRVLVIGFATTSIATMLTSNQEIYMPYETTYIAVAKAHYSYSSGLWYKLIVDAVLGVFALLSSILAYKMTKFSHTEPKTTHHFFLLLVDWVMTTLTISGCAAASAVGMVALQGVEKPGISWSPVCPLARKFCFMATVSIASSYAAFTCMTALTFLSACKLMLLATH